jgi:hypothetical protein
MSREQFAIQCGWETWIMCCVIHGTPLCFTRNFNQWFMYLTLTGVAPSELINSRSPPRLAISFRSFNICFSGMSLVSSMSSWVIPATEKRKAITSQLHLYPAETWLGKTFIWLVLCERNCSHSDFSPSKLHFSFSVERCSGGCTFFEQQ